MRVTEPAIITTSMWKAAPAKAKPVWLPAPERIIFHHTAGHHQEISHPADESYEEAVRYARDIQHFHMAAPPHGRGWNDSGHNFLVCRNGLILVGRHESYTAIREGRMVRSAHCPGQNDQPGIEHEHNGSEGMTGPQFEASAWLSAWIIDRCRMKDVPVYPHGAFWNTDCPGSLRSVLGAYQARVKSILQHGKPVQIHHLGVG